MADLIGGIRKIMKEEFDSAKKRTKKGFELAKKRMKVEFESAEKRMNEEFESAEKRIWTRIEGIFRDGNRTSVQRNMKLQFKNRISQKILTGEEIKGEDKNPLEVALIDESTGNIVDGGPESSATVEILLLKGVPNASEGGDWTVDQFNENIVREVKKPLFAENKLVKLENGIGFLENMKFRHHAIKMRPSLFRLGARVVNTFHGVRIKEAKSESFVVKDFRNKYYIKHETPSLSDEVYRLVSIRKGGKIEKRLQDHKICTVEDFLIRLLTDSEGLKRIVNLGEKKWKLIVKNALACPSDTKLYCYMNERRMTCVVFNLLGQILGLYMERQYASTDMLPEKDKADAEKLLESAYKHWEKVESFDDESSLQQYLNSLDCPAGGYEDAGTSEMIKGSSSRSNFSFSTMNSISESGVEDFSSFGPDDMELIPEAFLQLSPSSTLDFDKIFPDFDEYINKNDNGDMQLNGLINELNADEFAEFRDVQITRKPSKRWRKLF